MYFYLSFSFICLQFFLANYWIAYKMITLKFKIPLVFNNKYIFSTVKYKSKCRYRLVIGNLIVYPFFFFTGSLS